MTSLNIILDDFTIGPRIPDLLPIYKTAQYNLTGKTHIDLLERETKDILDELCKAKPKITIRQN
jgi:hypothetical protein